MKTRHWLTLAGLVLIMGLASLLPGEGSAFGVMAIFPPLVAIAAAIMTGQILSALLIGVAAGAFIKHGGEPEGVLQPFVYFWDNTVGDSFHLWTLAFIIALMAMARVMLHSGGMSAMAHGLARFAGSIRATQLVTVFMGLAVFFDDYANSVIVGNTARPLTDARKISREKLAFLVDATAAPIAGLALISTWVGYEVGLFDDALKVIGQDMSGYELFLQAIPYRFYCILMLVFVLLTVWLRRDYGPMHSAERRARTEGLVSAPDAHVPHQPNVPPGSTHWAYAVLPLGLVLGASFALLYLDGGGPDLVAKEGFTLQTLGKAFSEADNIRMLTYAALMGLASAMLLPVMGRALSLKDALRSAFRAVLSSWLVVAILTLAWSLGSACKDVGTANFLIAAIGDGVSPILLPALVFLTAGGVAFATGTSWGTMAILLPAVIPLASEVGALPLVIVTAGAVLDGAIFGDHCSPISDTTILSSSASGCDHLHHVKTQLPYALTVMGVALVFGYLPAAAGLHPLLALLMGGVALVATVLVVGKRLPG